MNEKFPISPNNLAESHDFIKQTYVPSESPEGFEIKRNEEREKLHDVVLSRMEEFMSKGYEAETTGLSTLDSGETLSGHMAEKTFVFMEGAGENPNWASILFSVETNEDGTEDLVISRYSKDGSQENFQSLYRLQKNQNASDVENGMDPKLNVAKFSAGTARTYGTNINERTVNLGNDEGFNEDDGTFTVAWSNTQGTKPKIMLSYNVGKDSPPRRMQMTTFNPTESAS